MDKDILDKLRVSYIAYSIVLILLVMYNMYFAVKIPKSKMLPNIKKHIIFLGLAYLIALFSDVYDTIITFGNANVNWMHLPRFFVQYILGLLGLIPLTLHLHKKESSINDSNLY